MPGGHLPNDLIGWQGDPHVSPFHLASYIVMGAGFILLARAWPVPWRAQRAGRPAVTGPYAAVRHPRYVGFVLIMAGFLLQWPTLLTMAMFPILALLYARLARAEEREVRAAFDADYDAYAAATPRFIPHLDRKWVPHAGWRARPAKREVAHSFDGQRSERSQRSLATNRGRVAP